MLSVQEKQKFGKGDRKDQLEVLETKLEDQMMILKSSTDIKMLTGAQSAVRILEALIAALS